MGAPAKQQGFPNDSFFKEILRRAKLSSSDDWFIHDPANKIKTTYTQLLQDVLTFKATLRNSLSVDTLRVLDSSEEETGLNFFIFAPSGYYFLVAFLAILALGGVAVPLAHNINVEEASYLLQKFRAVCLLSTPQQQSTIKKILAHANKANGATQLSVELPFKDETSTDDTTALRIDNGTGFPPGRAATLMFSSGTTGPPKGIVHSRRYWCALADSSAPRTSAEGSLSLSTRAMHWTGGLRPDVLSLLGGCRIEYLNDRPVNGSALWERLRKKGVTALALNPIMWNRMKQHYDDNLSALPTEELHGYVSAARALDMASSVGGFVIRPVQLFWRKMLGNRSLQIFYATTEAAPIMLQPFGANEDSDERVIGTPCANVEVKLSEGHHGEILVKGPFLFSCYYEDEKKTREAFDENGFYRTGDLGHFNGKHYIIDGRESTDMIQFCFWNIPGLELQSHILSLPYIEEAYVLSVPDIQVRTRAAALIRLKGPSKKLPLHKLRSDLSATMPLYKLPTLMRVLDEHERFPMTESGRLQIKEALRMYFPQTVNERIEDLPPQVEVWDITKEVSDKPLRPWDWSGLPLELIPR